MSNFIKTQNLKYSYNTEEEATRLVLDDVNLTINQGEFVAIIGHNGSGKSTLAKHFNGILLPLGGAVYVSGMDTKDEENLLKIRQKAGMVFQNPDNQIVATIVEEDVAFGPENLGVKQEDIRKNVDYALKAVDMYEFREHAPHQLSGGQKQRVAIAGIIAMKPKCIILDEPTAMLDPSGRREVLSVIHRLNKEENITIVLITHYMNEAASADRIVIMDRGKVLLDGTPKEVFAKRDTLKAVGLEVPQVTELMHCLSCKGYNLNTDVISVDECVNELINFLEDMN